MKLMCKCGNIEDVTTDTNMRRFELKNCEDNTLILICKKCNDSIFIKLK